MYPVVSHWAWTDDGWLNKNGYKDFAGSGVVHLTGGICALVGTYCMQPRLGRFTKQGQPIEMAGHSVPLAGLGGFILLFGFLAFNGGSQLAISNPGDVETVGLAIVNTIIGGCSGGLGVLLINRFVLGQKWSYLMSLNGALTGMVSQCAGCNVFQPWAAFIIGGLAAGVFMGVHLLMLKIKLDDPLDAVAVHAGGGSLGVICAPFFAYGTGIFWLGSLDEEGAKAAWNALGYNIAGLVTITVWSTFWGFAIFGTLKLLKMLRIDRETEFRGNDLVKHGESAYPRDAWVELQYSQKKSVMGEAPNLPHMGGSNDDGAGEKAYNDPNAMLPTMSKMMPFFRAHSNNAFELNDMGKAQEQVNSTVKD